MTFLTLKTRVLVILWIFGLSNALAQQTAEDNTNMLLESFQAAQNPLGFQENKGQIADLDGNAAPYVLFTVKTPGLIIWVTNTGLTYEFFEHEEDGEWEEEYKNGQTEREENVKIEWKRVDMVLKGANIATKNMRLGGQLPTGRVDFYQGHCSEGILDVKTYASVTFINIYPGIDWVLKTTENNTLKYEFVVRAGADPSLINLLYEGNGKFDIDDNRVRLSNSIGSLNEGTLLCYQDKQVIQSSYKQANREDLHFSGAGIRNTGGHQSKLMPGRRLFSKEISFRLGPYDKTKPLIIDPELYWATNFGGNNSDGITSFAFDDANNMFATGYTQSMVSFPLLDAGTFYQGTKGNPYYPPDVFVLKFNSSHTLMWCTYYGGIDYEQANAIEVDAANNVWVTGETSSVNFPVQSGSTYYQGTIGSISTSNIYYNDCFVLKFDNTGNRLFATFLGGTYNDVGSSIKCDLSGNLWLTGYTKSANFPVQNGLPGYYQGTLSPPVGPFAWEEDFFLMKFDPSMNILHSTFIGGSDGDIARKLHIDQNNTVWLYGETRSTNFPTLDAGTFFQGTLADNTAAFAKSDLVILKMDDQANLLWSTYYGGTEPDNAGDILVNSQNEVWISAMTNSGDFPLLSTGTFFQGTLGGTNDIALVRFDYTGNLLYSTYFGGSASENSGIGIMNQSLAIDTCDNLYFSFLTKSSNVTTFNPGCTGDYFDGSYAGDDDAFFARFDRDANLTWGTYFGGISQEIRPYVGIDNFNNLYITGEYRLYNSSTGMALLDPGNGAYYSTSVEPTDDIFLLKFISSNVPDTLHTTSPCNGCNGAAWFPNGGSYNWYDANDSLLASGVDSISGLCAGSYYVIGGICEGKCPLWFNLSCGFSVSIPDTTICEGDSVLLTSTVTNSSGPLVYAWTPLPDTTPDISVSPLVTTTYVITVSDTLHTASDTATVTVIPPVFVHLGSDTTFCDGALVLNALNPGATYLWQDSSVNQTLTVNQSGLYWVQVKHGSCEWADSINVVIHNPVVDLGNDTITCDPTFTLDAGAGFTYVWQDSSINQVFTVNDTGIFYVAVTDTNGCSASDTIVVKPDSLAVFLGNDTTLCSGNNLTLVSGLNTGTHSWNDSSALNHLIVSDSGTYWVTVTQGLCMATDTVHIAYADPQALFVSSDTIGCSETEFLFTDLSTGNVTGWFWDFGDGFTSSAQNPTHIYTAGGLFNVSLTISSMEGCPSDTAEPVLVTIVQQPVAQFDFAPKPPVPMQQVQFTDQSVNATAWDWSFGDGGSSALKNPNHTYTAEGSYTILLVVSNQHCTDSTWQTLDMIEDILFYVPNSFTPNGDGINDTFFPVFSTVNGISYFRMRIFNRWGELIFESDSPSEAWTGKFKGYESPSDVYIWQIEYTGRNSKFVFETSKIGHVTLIR